MDNVDFTGSHMKYMKNVSFPWPLVVAAHFRNGLARAMQNSGS
jgi:hypothetical protein